jgi:glucose-6-phosphate dehydrogenase assembly protein OpcA
VTDAAAEAKPLSALRQRADGYQPGDTDLAWTRLTPWRAVLAAALDQPFDPIHSATVAAQRSNPSAELLAAWLGLRLDVPVERKTSRGPGITAVRLETEKGDIALTRPDGRLGRLARPGDPDRTVALARRDIPEILAEELRRLDPDEIYEYCLRAIPDENGANQNQNPNPTPTPTSTEHSNST